MFNNVADFENNNVDDNDQSGLVFNFLQQYLDTGKLIEISYNMFTCYIEGYIIGLQNHFVKILVHLGDNNYKMVILSIDIIDCVSADIIVNLDNLDFGNKQFNLNNYYDKKQD